MLLVFRSLYAAQAAEPQPQEDGGSALRIALQGLAPFPLSSVAIAVQGLIEQIQREHSQVYGNGSRKPGPAPDSLLRDIPLQQKENPPDNDVDLVRQVIEKWEAIEAAKAQDQAESVAKVPAKEIASPLSDVPANAPSAEAQSAEHESKHDSDALNAIDVANARALRARHDDEVMWLLAAIELMD